MLKVFRSWSLSPALPDEDTTRVAGILNFILVQTILVFILYGLLTSVLFTADERNARLLMSVVVIGICALAKAFLHTGRVRTITLMVLIPNWLIINFATWIGGGIERPVFALQIVIIIVAILCLGNRIALGFLIASILMGLGMYYAQTQLWLPPVADLSLTVGAFTQITTLIACGAVLYVAAHSLNDALNRARKSEQALKERNRLLEQEIAERKRVEAALRYSEERLRLATHSAKIGIWEWDIHTGKVTWDENVYRLMGVDKDKFDGKLSTFMNSLHPEDREAASHTVQTTLPNGTYQIIESRVIRPDNSLRWMQGEGRLYRDEKGDPQCIIGIAQDITERKQAEQERIDIALERQRIGLLKEFIGNLSHDLKTPLTVINTSLHMMGILDDPLRQKEKLTVIHEQVTLLNGMIQKILQISRLDHDQELVIEPIAPNQLLAACMRILHPSAEKKNITLIPMFDPEAADILGNEDELQRALLNLIENAVNYTPDGGCVTLTTYQNNQQVFIEVQDTGMGISQDDLPLIFNRFYRSQRTRKMAAAGSGLGLAIVKQVIEMHNGTIEVESVERGGTTFRLSLPVAAALV